MEISKTNYVLNQLGVYLHKQKGTKPVVFTNSKEMKSIIGSRFPGTDVRVLTTVPTTAISGVLSTDEVNKFFKNQSPDSRYKRPFYGLYESKDKPESKGGTKK